MARTKTAKTTPNMSIKKITVLCTDLRAFSELFAGLTAKQFAAMTNTYYEDAGEIIKAAGGTIDKFLGDSVIAFFNAQKRAVSSEQQAVDAAIQLKARIEERWPGLPISIGIATGKAVTGKFGPKFHRPFTAFGQVIHRANVLERRSHFTGYKILVDADTQRKLGKNARTDDHPSFVHASLEGKGVFEIGLDAKPATTNGRGRAASKR